MINATLPNYSDDNDVNINPRNLAADIPPKLLQAVEEIPTNYYAALADIAR